MGQLISTVGTWMQNTSQAWLVLQITNSAAALGVVSALQVAPSFILTLFAGAVADRYDKRRLLIATQSCLALQALVLGTLVAMGLVRVWHIALLAVFLGTTNAFDMPLRHALVYDLVGKEDLTSGVSLSSAAFNLARAVGPALSGVLMATLGAAPCFFANAASFLAVIVGLAMIRTEKQIAAARAVPDTEELAPAWQAVVQGVGYVARTARILLPLLFMGILSVFVMNFNVMIPLFARGPLNLRETGYGILVSTFGLGSLLGALSVAWLGRRGPRPSLMVAGAAVLCFGHVMLSLARSVVPAVAVLALEGAAMLVFLNTTNAWIQLSASEGFRGRVMGAYTWLLVGVGQFGSVFTGGVAQLMGVRGVLAIGAGVGTAATVAFAILLQRYGIIRLAPRAWLPGLRVRHARTTRA